MTRARTALAALAMLSLGPVVLAACGGSDKPAVALDGSPRVPDDEGVLTSVSRKEVVLDGVRRYGVRDDVISFSTYTAMAEPMANRQGQYVQIGLRGKKVAWMAGVAAVVPGDPPAVFYTGRFERVDDGKAVFQDGTVLTLGPGVKTPPPKARTQARIDAKAHHVIGFVGV